MIDENFFSTAHSKSPKLYSLIRNIKLAKADIENRKSSLVDNNLNQINIVKTLESPVDTNNITTIVEDDNVRIMCRKHSNKVRGGWRRVEFHCKNSSRQGREFLTRNVFFTRFCNLS